MEQKELTTGTETLRPEQTEGERIKAEMIVLLKKLMVAERSLPDKERSLPSGFALEGEHAFKLFEPQKYEIKFSQNGSSGVYWTMWVKGRGELRGVCSIVIFLPSRNKEEYPDQIKVKTEAHFRKNYEYTPLKKEG